MSIFSDVDVPSPSVTPRLLADFLYVRAIELLLFYFNLSAQVRSKKNITAINWVSKSEIIEPRRR
ncbi:MAG: hypothetical protein JGK17_22570 [Microcoleus sp. PH2017_10_PVI_O_A]|uniref:hypothetical protein n=1 Tax=unclassified Microcoleus TaxID=2642155 RepID=UPI001D36E33B|nr:MULTISPECIES: hypothetical protein [unclassified Microcoleus]MCC3408321.1 hypothetical protein [Microcoleus sp. PH2017_10_PVI_O_A]MCC3461607.1 hypothetical protein [Microcoleus sp. PH2017_11_PCY_U_A]MCC3480882.1 hypothetical protein [Microcoleus sp. PH2017_12_PCY_D_A]MCC3530789.1 hypothetical protein [Microcoleus sp. PH2017_21_RUC_O_A]MCC3543167.1 hypothetical protein [Microcoleus sp. PH2017_22_RUC_O_B]